MKSTLLILLFALSMLFPVSDVFAPPPPDHQHAFNYSEHVIIGKILSVEIISEPRITKTETFYSEQAGIALYKIDVEEYLKNPLDTNTMKVPGYFSYNYDAPQNVIDPLYEMDEKVFLYIQPDSHETLSDYDLIIRSYESRSLDKMGPICDEPDTFYYKGKCIANGQEPEPKNILIDPCDSTVLNTFDICTNSLSLYPTFVINAFLLVVGFLIYWFTWGVKK